MWVLSTGNDPISAGLVSVEASGRGVAVFQTPATIPTPTGVAVTLEDAPGLPAPKGDMFLLGSAAP